MDLYNLYPERYETTNDSVDENKIYEYVRKYLYALKLTFAEPDFQKLLYDPEYWIQESPYR